MQVSRQTLRRSLVIGTLTLALVGCATGPNFTETKSKMPALKAGEGRIFVYRDGIFGAAVKPRVMLNGTEVGVSAAKGFFYVDRPAGSYKISSSTEVERSVSFELSGGEQKYISSSISLGVLVGRLNFELVSQAVGEAALSSLAYTGQ